MARLTGENIEQFRASSGNSQKIKYFALKDDKETAKIRLLYNGAEDIEGYVVHRVKVGDWELPVNCLLEKDGTIDDCPFCREKFAKQARVFIPVFDETDGEFKFWERPNNFYGKISGLCSRYPKIVSQVFEVERLGAKGYQKTDYQFYPIGQPDGTTIDDILDDCGIDEMPSALGTKILDKTADDMEYYIRHGEFKSASEDTTPVRRRGTVQPTEDLPFEVGEEQPARRTRGRGDRF